MIGRLCVISYYRRSFPFYVAYPTVCRLFYIVHLVNTDVWIMSLAAGFSADKRQQTHTWQMCIYEPDPVWVSATTDTEKVASIFTSSAESINRLTLK